MNEDQLIAGSRKGSKQLYLWTAKFFAYGFLGFALVAALQFVIRIWLIFFVDLGGAALTGCLAVVFYALSHKASGE